MSVFLGSEDRRCVCKSCAGRSTSRGGNVHDEEWPSLGRILRLLVHGPKHCVRLPVVAILAVRQAVELEEVAVVRMLGRQSRLRRLWVGRAGRAAEDEADVDEVSVLRRDTSCEAASERVSGLAERSGEGKASGRSRRVKAGKGDGPFESARQSSRLRASGNPPFASVMIPMNASGFEPSRLNLGQPNVVGAGWATSSRICWFWQKK